MSLKVDVGDIFLTPSWTLSSTKLCVFVLFTLFSPSSIDIQYHNFNMEEKEDIFSFFKEKRTRSNFPKMDADSQTQIETIDSSDASSDDSGSSKDTKLDTQPSTPPKSKKKIKMTTVTPSFSSPETKKKSKTISDTSVSSPPVQTSSVTSERYEIPMTQPEEDTMIQGGGSSFPGATILVHDWVGFYKNKGYIKRRHSSFSYTVTQYCQGIIDLLDNNRASEDYKYEIYFQYELYVNLLKDISHDIFEYREFCIDIVDEYFILKYIKNVKDLQMAKFIKMLAKCEHYEITFVPFPAFCNYQIATTFSHIKNERYFFPKRELVDYTNTKKKN